MGTVKGVLAALGSPRGGQRPCRGGPDAMAARGFPVSQNSRECHMTSFPAAALQTAPAPAAGPLPPAGRVLAVTARPGQESAELGGLLFAFRRAGASLGLLSLTRGEASPLNGAWVIDLGADAGTARTIQKSAVAAHASQSEALSRLTRRVDLLDSREHVRWLVARHQRPAGRRDDEAA